MIERYLKHAHKEMESQREHLARRMANGVAETEYRELVGRYKGLGSAQDVLLTLIDKLHEDEDPLDDEDEDDG